MTTRLFHHGRGWKLLRWFSNTVPSEKLIVNIREDGKSLNLASRCGSISTNYYSQWLRHNCQCGSCLSSSGQKLVNGDIISENAYISKAVINDKQLNIEWKGTHSFTPHFGHIDLHWLQENACNEEKRNKKRKESIPIKNTTTLPFIDYKDLSSNEGIWSWLHHLNEVGVCIINDVPVTDYHIKQVAQKIYNIQQTLYDETFDVKSEAHVINIAYSEIGLELHMDLMYYQSPPGLQLLHCLKNDPCVEGGESTLLDGIAVVEELKNNYPKHFEVLSTVHVPFEKIHYERDKPVGMIYSRPIIELDRNGEVIGIHWAPAHQGTISVSEDVVEDFYEAYVCFFDMINNSPSIMKHRLVPGQLLSFNNHRMFHGRMPYKSNGGERHLKGLYVNIDEFSSKLCVLSRQLNKSNSIKHVLNGSYYI